MLEPGAKLLLQRECSHTEKSGCERILERTALAKSTASSTPGALLGQTLRLDLAPAGDVGGMLGKRGGEYVPAGAVGDEVERVRLRRVGRGFQRGAAGIADRRRRQAVDPVGVV